MGLFLSLCCCLSLIFITGQWLSDRQLATSTLGANEFLKGFCLTQSCVYVYWCNSWLKGRTLWLVSVTFLISGTSLYQRNKSNWNYQIKWNKVKTPEGPLQDVEADGALPTWYAKESVQVSVVHRDFTAAAVQCHMQLWGKRHILGLRKMQTRHCRGQKWSHTCTKEGVETFTAWTA